MPKDIKVIVVLPDTKARFDALVEAEKEKARHRNEISQDTVIVAALDALEKAQKASEQ
jgi:hypothetical protein